MTPDIDNVPADLFAQVASERDRLERGLVELVRLVRMHPSFDDVELIQSVMGSHVAQDRRELEALIRLLDQCPDPGASVEHVVDRHGMSGVVLRWEDEGLDLVELWWFTDEAHADLYLWQPGDSA